MKYPIFKTFQDLQDKKKVNEKDKFYPREGLKPSPERVKELQVRGFIGDEVPEDKPKKKKAAKK